MIGLHTPEFEDFLERRHNRYKELIIKAYSDLEKYLLYENTEAQRMHVYQLACHLMRDLKEADNRPDPRG